MAEITPGDLESSLPIKTVVVPQPVAINHDTDSDTDIPDGKESHIKTAESVAQMLLEEKFTPKAYDTIADAFKGLQVSDPYRLDLDERGPVVINPQSGERMFHLRDLGRDIVKLGEKYLKNFAVEVRLNDRNLPIVVAYYDLNERYQMVVGIEEPYDNQDHKVKIGLPMGIDDAYGKQTFAFLVDRDKENNAVFDLGYLGVLDSGNPDYFIVANEHDFQGVVGISTHGTSLDNEICFRLITNARSLATFLHEKGHRRFHAILTKIHPERAAGFISLYEEAKASFGDTPNQSALKAVLIDELTASESGKRELLAIIDDEKLRQDVDGCLDAISKRYADRIVPYLY